MRVYCNYYRYIGLNFHEYYVSYDENARTVWYTQPEKEW